MGNEDVHELIACPVCRASTSLGREGVADLPPNFHLAETVRRLSSAVKVEDDIPYCSVCEEDNHAKAVKFCTNCGVFYCHECLAVCHLMRGSLKRHRLISSLEYLSQETSQGQVSRGHQLTQQPSCAGHGQPFVLYCVPCRTVICVGCVVHHPKHAMLDIKSAAENDKPDVLTKTRELEKVLQETRESLSGVMKLHKKIQGSTDFIKTIDDRLNEIRADLEKREVSRQKLLDFVQHDQVVPRHVTVMETVRESQDLEAAVGEQTSPIRVTKPTLRFTETDDGKLRIADSGSVVKADVLYWVWRRAVTDGRYQTGRYYWEIHITFSRDCNCRVGVTQESCGVRGRTDPGRNTWYIGMVYHGDEVSCYSHCGGEIKPGYLQYRRPTRSHHLGVYLDCDDPTLTVLDCDNNQVIGTVSDVVVTEPLVPWVGFYVWSGSVSARLITGDSATLPPVLCDMISTS